MNLLNLVQYCYKSSTSSPCTRPGVRTMAIIDKLFLFLVRIRLGLFQQDLAHRFNVHDRVYS